MNGGSELSNEHVKCGSKVEIGIMRTLLLLAMVVTTASVRSQNTGTLRLLVDPGHNFEFVVDKKHRMQQREVKLSEGLHHFSFWAPERMVVDTNVFVVADRTSDLVLKLPNSPEYIAYRRALAQHQSKRRVARTIPTVVTGGALIWTSLSLVKYQKARDVLEADRETYEIDVRPASIRTLKETTIPAHNEDLRKARTGVYTALGTTAICGAITYYLYRRSAKWDKPVFEDKQKVVFDGLVWLPSERGGMFHAGITIPLAR